MKLIEYKKMPNGIRMIQGHYQRRHKHRDEPYLDNSVKCKSCGLVKLIK